MRTEFQNNLLYFKVEAKCGHVGGRNNYIPISFGVKANSSAEAAEKTRWFARVKHHNKKAILSVEKITFEDFCVLIEQNKSDPYLSSTNRKTQNYYSELINPRILPEEPEENYKKYDAFTKRTLYSGKQQIRKPKKWNNMFCPELG